jgi:hypothetical protein
MCLSSSAAIMRGACLHGRQAGCGLTASKFQSIHARQPCLRTVDVSCCPLFVHFFLICIAVGSKHVTRPKEPLTPGGLDPQTLFLPLRGHACIPQLLVRLHCVTDSRITAPIFAGRGSADAGQANPGRPHERRDDDAESACASGGWQDCRAQGLFTQHARSVIRNKRLEGVRLLVQLQTNKV